MIKIAKNGRDYSYWTFLSTDAVTECWKCRRIINRQEYYLYRRDEKDNLITERCICKDCATGKGAV